jgi:site-specific DNA-methyltransferase (adenine-specific)
MRAEVSGRLLNGDCMELLRRLPDGCVGMVLTDPPYGGTENPWDVAPDWDALWPELKRVGRPGAVYCVFSQCPYDKPLGMSNLKWLRYEWIWVKDVATGFLNARRAPLKLAENVLVFCDRAARYSPQMTEGRPYSRKPVARHHPNWNRIKYQPGYDNGGERFPLNVLHFPQERDGGHPTPKPVALCEYLIRTHSAPGDLVLDVFAGGGPVPAAAIRTGRDWLAFERDPGYWRMASERAEREIESRERSVLAPLTARPGPPEPPAFRPLLEGLS